ncbi:hypothetical protein C2869_04785 [Saccharobesus litoralis]|uniref:Uncharacterized protein n=1 Tax=Saccharobesus litoralis TaxID=2172099 RepID=A0A2S0VNJ9_9ALTE|nr:hypothetical protein C2869_04785 [Saccharobesus litoralis]
MDQDLSTNICTKQAKNHYKKNAIAYFKNGIVQNKVHRNSISVQIKIIDSPNPPSFIKKAPIYVLKNTKKSQYVTRK